MGGRLIQSTPKRALGGPPSGPATCILGPINPQGYPLGGQRVKALITYMRDRFRGTRVIYTYSK